MLPRLDATSIAPVSPARAIAALKGVADPRQELFERSLQTLVGKSLQGQVLGRLTDGSFVVRVNGTPARMMLPPGAQPGAEVPLTLVALSPRPTFQVGAFPGGSAAATLSEALATALPEGAPAGAHAAAPQRALAQAALRANVANAAMLPAEHLPTLESDTPHATLSEAAKVITGVLATALKAPNPPTAVIAPAPLLDRPAPEAAKLAGALKHAIDSSGLFYESHLREWSEGARPLADLAREPQMQKVLDGGAAKPGAALTDPATAQFINLQLASHEQQRVAWHGELWPGQPLQWEVSRDAPERRPGGADPEPAWRSTVRFRFPLLGEIGASVVMAGGELHVQVQAGTADIERLLQAHAGKLANALDAAGSPLSSLNIRAARD
ncbi:flagellar hook-length control protein FliK [Massilia sp. R2A-15]|uniref:flagellar hook-length control protein FliK n=1 Tax=Massilia sp. R2A-15 TaxID=3064278 RepID=UPI00273635C8|nr:flagellar hook-length control protein FliK [Massilia sp. R2A-15]WLI87969.1 flagellar hook-length control protein FliK [Massilia sp. R2A-15]